tara:strand:+ start:172 stop:1086 length:915 start_codon:yes stop_codon:yes gene_type:complete
MMTHPTDTAEERAFRKLTESSLFQTYRTAFRLATGLDVELRPAGEEDDPDTSPGQLDANEFCSAMDSGKGCAACVLARKCLFESASHQAKSVKCFAGLRETAIPIRSGNNLIAFLRTGQVFHEAPAKSEFEAIAPTLEKEGIAATKELESAFLDSPVMDSKKYLGAITLLAAFSLQLSEEFSRLMIAEENSDPPMVIKAKQYINAHLEDKITLDAVADYCSVSPYYFCKLFKTATGMTLTEYVNRRRIEWAKRKLLNPQLRITEVAYDVGYQSLSQFNRSFLRYAGESPTHFRENSLIDSQLAA